MTSSPRRPRLEHAALLLAALLAGCASQSRAVERLPFHVAIAPTEVSVDAQMSSLQRDGDPTEMALQIDAKQVGKRLAASLESTFMRVTILTADAASPSTSSKDWASKARASGADLLLRPVLTYSPTVHSSLNDRFWLNLPLFAIGGPFSWFVADRSYYCDSELAGSLIDVSLATAESMRAESVDDDAKVVEVTSPATETSLNFLDRADGAMPYLLSLVVPAGLLSSESGATKGALDASVVDQVSQAFANGLLDRGNNITRWRGVTFFPRDVRAEVVDGKRVLRGQLWLVPGAATAVSSVRHRLANQDWQQTDYREADKLAPTATSKGRTTYEFEIPISASYAGSVQFDVTQNDRFQTHRTFTYQL